MRVSRVVLVAGKLLCIQIEFDESHSNLNHLSQGGNFGKKLLMWITSTQ
jgi:hypothetical protein